MSEPPASDLPPPPPQGGFPAPPPPADGGFAPPPPAGSPAPPGTGGGPVHLDLQAPLEVARWRPLVHWLLALPYAIVVGVLGWLGGIAGFIAFFTVVFTKRVPEGLFNFMTMCFRSNWRATSYELFLREPYPPFNFDSTAVDPGDDPATLTIDAPGEMSRLLPFVKWLLAIPHFFVLVVLGIGLYFAVVIAFFAVLITGRWPEGLRNYVIGVTRWGFRVMAYLYFMTDEYPPFSLD